MSNLTLSGLVELCYAEQDGAYRPTEFKRIRKGAQTVASVTITTQRSGRKTVCLTYTSSLAEQFIDCPAEASGFTYF